MAVDHDEVRVILIQILRQARATNDEIELVERMVDLWESGHITNEDLFHYVMGVAWYYLIPLTPKQVGDIARLLGVELGVVV